MAEGSAAADEAGLPPVATMAGRIAIALLQGGLLWWLYDAAVHDRWPVDQRGWLVGLIAAGMLVPLAHYLLAGIAPMSRQGPVLAVLAALSLGLGWHSGAWAMGEPHREFLSFPAALGVLVFHALPFVQHALRRGLSRPDYALLFQFAWRNALLGALGAVFAGVFWLLLALWGQLFHMLGIDLFRDLFESSAFAIPATTVAVGVGVQLAGSVERLQEALRQQVLTLLKWLAPLAILILVLFSIALLAKSPELFAEQRRAISAVWLLWLVALTVALLNAAYQDGGDRSPYPRWLGTSIRRASVLLLPVAGLAVYALGVRIASYGLTASRVWGFLVATIALGYAAGYAWAAAGRGAWMARMGVVNVTVALFTIAMLTLMLTPLLSPERLAAASQYRRVLADPGGDAYGELRFRSGRYGRERLASLARIESHPKSALVRARAGEEMRRRTPWGPDSAAPAGLVAEHLVAFPAGSRADPGLIAALDLPANARILSGCTSEEPCPLLYEDLDRDGAAEAILFAPYGVIGATRSAGGWRPLSRLVHMERIADEVAHHDRATIRRALEQGRYRVGAMPWQPIEIGGESFLLADPPAAEPACAQAGDALSEERAVPGCP